MPIKDKKSLIIAVLAILAIAIAGYFFISEFFPSNSEKISVEEGFLQEIEEESVITNQEDSDANFINADDNEINSLGNSVNENEI